MKQSCTASLVGSGRSLCDKHCCHCRCQCFLQGLSLVAANQAFASNTIVRSSSIACYSLTSESSEALLCRRR